MKNLHDADIRQTFLPFVTYCLEFYGDGGIYDMGATETQVLQVAIDYLQSPDREAPFHGDSFDREMICTRLQTKFGLTEKVQEPYPVPESHGLFTLNLKPIGDAA